MADQKLWIRPKISVQSEMARSKVHGKSKDWKKQKEEEDAHKV